jgi:hypothetical protein
LSTIFFVETVRQEEFLLRIKIAQHSSIDSGNSVVGDEDIALILLAFEEPDYSQSKQYNPDAFLYVWFGVRSLLFSISFSSVEEEKEEFVLEGV